MNTARNPDQRSGSTGNGLLRLVAQAAMICGLALLTACGKPPAPREVIVYASVDQIYSEPILKAFEARSGIKVRAVYDVEAAKTTGLVTRLVAEKARPQADVFWSGEFAQTIGLRHQGVLAAYRSPSATDLPDEFKDPDGYWTGMGGRARVFLVNTRLLPPAQHPQGLADLLDDRWPAATVGIANPLFGTTATQAAALYAQWGAERARTFYGNLHARGVRVVDGNSVVRDLVASGQLAFGLTDTDDAAEALQKGAAVAVVLPDQDGDGTLVVPGTVAMVAGAPHADAAAALIDYLLAADTERELIRLGGCQTSLRRGTARGDSAFAAIKPMRVSLHEIQAALPTAQKDLRDIFLR
jgi:iron(III) transport system substrate-binding protein